MQPPADRRDSRKAVLDPAKLVSCEIRELVGIAIPTGQSAAQQMREQFLRRVRLGDRQIEFVGSGRRRHDRIVADETRSGREPHATDSVAMRVGENARAEIVSRRERLEDHRMIAIRQRLNVQQKRSRAVDLVAKIAADTNGEIENAGWYRRRKMAIGSRYRPARCRRGGPT